MNATAPNVFAWKPFLIYLLFLTISSVAGVYVFFKFFFGLDGAILLMAVLISWYLNYGSKEAQHLRMKLTLSNKAGSIARQGIAKRAILSVWLVAIVFLVGLIN